MSVWRYPFAWDAPCPQTPEEQPAGWCHTHGNGRYGLKQTLLPAPVRSGQCDSRPQLTEGVLCDLPHVFAFVFPAVTLTLTPTLTLTLTQTLTLACRARARKPGGARASLGSYRLGGRRRQRPSSRWRAAPPW